MSNSSVQHLITGDELDKKSIQDLLSLAIDVKKHKSHYSQRLAGQNIAMIFEKPSLRTRFSFTAAINQLGGHAIESEPLTRKTEAPKDFIRVIQGYCSAVMIRTFDNDQLAEMVPFAKIPIINGLTNEYHPCQSLADLLTLKEVFNSFDHLKIAYIGDGNNVLHSLMIMATKLGIAVHYCCPKGHGPDPAILETIADPSLITAFSDPKEAVENCHAVYTDVWTSMGFPQKDELAFSGYQVDKKLMDCAEKNAVFMHCMPMERGKEVSDDLPDSPCSVIFQQSENRLYIQQALLLTLI